MMDPDFIKRYLFQHLPGEQGGQELLALELIAALKQRGVSILAMPYAVGSFSLLALRCEIALVRTLPGAQALYLGTPTIVNNKKLFPESAPGEWDVEIERRTMRDYCAAATWVVGLDTIITGLGSGDISEEERMEDMRLPGWTEPTCFCMKDFGEFKDWLFITTRIKE